MLDTFPNALAMREIKYGPKSSDAERIATARRLENAGRLAEALDLFLIAEDEAGIAGLRERALREGRPLLLLMLARMNRAATAAEWKQAGDSAFRDGRWREAFRAYTEAGDTDSLARVKEKIPDYSILTPQAK